MMSDADVVPPRTSLITLLQRERDVFLLLELECVEKFRFVVS